MKEEMLNIGSDLREGFISANEAKEQLLDLFGVSDNAFKDRTHYSDLLKCCNKILDSGDIDKLPQKEIAELRTLLNR